MRLESFQVTNFRSITDSGPIDVAKITAVLGRNESGKSNLLRALHSLNPAEGFDALNPIKDFPRHRRLEECKPDTPVLSSLWTLDDDEQAALLEVLPRAKDVKSVAIGRRYDKTRTITFVGLGAHDFNDADVTSKIRKIVPAVKAVAEPLEEDAKAKLEQAADTFSTGMTIVPDRAQWAAKAMPALAALRKALAGADAELTDKQDQLLVELEDLSASLHGDKERLTKARQWVVDQMPTFIYVDEYPALNGHQNIAEFLAKLPQPGTMTYAEHNFQKLCKVAGLDPQKLHDLLGQNEQETRNQLANRAGSVVTTEIRRLWKDRALKIRFNLDGNHLDTLISDPNATYDVEVNLGERSRGFQWFFSFYITFAADTDGGDAEDAILLLDEPGLYLHAKSQSDLLNHFQKDFQNQIIYTTHSPFMVPTQSLDSVRTVSIDEQKGTTVTNDPTGDARTLFPLQAALGYSLSQSLFVGANNLVVEGVTDYWMLSAVSEYLAEAGTGLHPELTLTPAGGAQKVSYMVALLSSQELNVLLLLDHEKEAQATKDELVKSKLISEHNVVFVSEGFAPGAVAEADTEDLFDPAIYEQLVRESYAKELGKTALPLNPKIPRIAKRFEAAFKELGMEFHKTRPARLLLKKMGADPAAMVPLASAKRFETLFKLINERLKKHVARSAEPFR